MYTIQLLDSPVADSSPFSQAFDINRHGQAVGVASDPSGFKAVLWKPNPVQLPLLGRSNQASAVNDSGEVVGFWGQDMMPGQGFIFRAGSMHDLTAVFNAEQSLALDINNAGMVVGSAGPIGSNHAFKYNSQAGTATDLGVLPGHSLSGASAINNHGQVTGISKSPQGPGHAFLHDGTLKDLGPATYANDLNDSGQIVGARVVGNATTWRAFLCETAGGTPQFEDLGPLPLPGFVGSEASAINNQGDIVGHSFSDFGGGQIIRAFIRPVGGVMQDLNALIPANSGWLLHWAASINDEGQIVGAGSYNGSYRAYRLTPDKNRFRTDQYALFVTILFGLIGGGGGVVFVPGSGPVPVDPEPFRHWAKLPPEKQDMLLGFALSELSALARDNLSRRELEHSALKVIRRALEQSTRAKSQE